MTLDEPHRRSSRSGVNDVRLVQKSLRHKAGAMTSHQRNCDNDHSPSWRMPGSSVKTPRLLASSAPKRRLRESLPLHTTPPNDPRREGSPVAPVASRFTLGSCRLMDTKAARTVALAALLIYVTGTASALCDLCPALLLDGTLTIPDTATLQLKAATHGGATLTGPHGAISGQAIVTCKSGKFNAMLYGMSDGSLYRCRATINGQRFSGHCVNGSVIGEFSGQFSPPP